MKWVILCRDTSDRSRGLFQGLHLAAGEQRNSLGREKKKAVNSEAKAIDSFMTDASLGGRCWAGFILSWEYLHGADPLLLKELYHSTTEETTEKTVSTKYSVLFWQSYKCLNSAVLMGFQQVL